MTKNILIGLGVILGVSFLLNIFQLTGGITKNKKIKKLTTSLAQVEQQAGTLASTNGELELNVTNLESENANLLDSVTYLNKKIHRYRSKIRSQDRRLKEVNESIALLQEKEAELTRQMSFAADIDDSQLVELQAQKASLERKIEGLEGRNDSLIAVKDKYYKKMLKSEVEKERFIKKDIYHQDLLDVIENTKVEFYELTPRRDNGKAAKSVKKWFDTKISFALDYDDLSKLEGEEFIVRIMDTKTGDAIPPQESGGNNVLNGISFIFAGNPAPEMTYTHFEQKESGNFTIQVYLKRQSNEYLLSEGVAAIEF